MPGALLVVEKEEHEDRSWKREAQSALRLSSVARILCSARELYIKETRERPQRNQTTRRRKLGDCFERAATPEPRFIWLAIKGRNASWHPARKRSFELRRAYETSFSLANPKGVEG